MLVSINQYYHGGISECRNPSLQKMFLMIGSAEKAGSGVNKIMSGWDFAHWRRPFLIVTSQPDRLTLELPMSSTIPEETIHQLREIFGDDIDVFGKEELTILTTCQIEGETSNYRLQFLIDQHRAEITRILQDLCKQGFLTSDNKCRWTTYHLNSDYGTQLAVNDFEIDSKRNTSKFIKGNTKRRLTKEELQENILKYCELEFYSVAEIAQFVDKDVDYLKEKGDS